MSTGRRNLAALLVSLPLLAACGGGGGGSSSVLPFTGFGALPDTGTVEMRGTARSASFEVDTATGQVTVSDVTTDPTASTLRLSIENGVLTRAALAAPGSSAAFDLETDSHVTADMPAALVFESKDGDRVALF
jgi:hypothetical protein